MSIFSGDIGDVADTKILTGIVYSRMHNGAPNLNDPLQLVVYSNNVSSAGAGAGTHIAPIMILPFPLKSGVNRIRLLDFSEYPTIFDDVDLFFPTQLVNDPREWTKDKPDVKTIGNYKTSIARLSDFPKLQRDFAIRQSIIDLLTEHYSRGFGFIICQILHAGIRGLLAYVHEIRSDGRLFIPTRRYHNKRVAYDISRFEEQDSTETDSNDIYSLRDDQYLSLYTKRIQMADTSLPPAQLDWDHDIYVINFARIAQNVLISRPGVSYTLAAENRVKNSNNYLRKKLLPQSIALGKIISMHKLHIMSVYKYNHDIII